MRTTTLFSTLFLTIILAQPVCGEVVLETDDLRLVISTDGMVQSVKAKATGMEYASSSNATPFATVYRGGKPVPSGTWEVSTHAEAAVHLGGQAFPASAVELDGNKLRIEFGIGNFIAVYEVIRKPRYLAFKLLSVEGQPVDRIDLVQLNIKKPPHLGPWINVAYDESFGICLCAGNVETNAGMNIKKDYIEMRAMAEKRVALEGTVAVLFAFTRDPAKKAMDPTKRFLDPKSDFLAAMEIVERDFNMPSGAKNRRSPIQKESYWWINATPTNIDAHIKTAKQAGFRMIVFSYQAFASQGAGHLKWNGHYPRGMADLKVVTDKIRAAGLSVGLHLHHSKADKTDRYVSPVPDDRLGKICSFTLAAGIDSKSDTILVQENPEGATRDKGRKILKIGKELVSYSDYTTKPPFTFNGCQRGHLNSASTAHAIGQWADLLDVDTWVRFVRFDQDTDIQDEAARRIGDIYRETGPYQLIYFDGSEDVHAPFWYNISRAQYRTYRQLKPEPVACEAGTNTHFSWHMCTRSNAYDCCGDSKNFVRRMPFRTAPVRLADFTRVQFGWMANIQPDVLEYVFSRAAAWDCPASVCHMHGELANGPRAEDCRATIRIWEDARLEGKLTDKQLRMLRTLDPVHYRFCGCGLQVKYNDRKFAGEGLTKAQLEKLWDLGQEHHLFRNEQGEYELVEIHEIPDVLFDTLKAYWFTRESRPDDTYVLIWAKAGSTDLHLPVAAEKLSVMRPFGTKLEIKPDKDGQPAVEVGRRMYLVFSAMNPAAVQKTIRGTTSDKTKKVVAYLPASAFSTQSGDFLKASTTGNTPSGAISDCMVPNTDGTFEAWEKCYIDYKFKIPEKGMWRIWARIWCGSSKSDSFFTGIPGDPNSKTKFGNQPIWVTLQPSEVVFGLGSGGNKPVVR